MHRRGEMDTVERGNYDSVLQTIRQWPVEKRFALIRDVIDTLERDAFPSQPRRKTLKRALGLLTTSGPAPSAAEIQQWLDEHRMEKYG